MPSTRSRNTRSSNPVAEAATTPRRSSRTSSRRVPSSPAQPRNDSDDTDVNEADSGNMEEGEDSEELDDTVPHTQGTINNDDNGDAHQEPGVLSDDDKQFFLMCLPDLQKTTDELMEKLRSEPQSAVQQRVLEFKKRAFSNAREQYILNTSTPNTSIFIDTTSFEGLDAEADGLMTALARANLVSTLDATRQDGDLLPVLEHLDNTFLDIFSPLGIGALNLDLALELRTQCFVTAFVQNDSQGWFENREWVLLLATLFCNGVEGVNDVIEAEPFLEDGPFRELCGYVDDTAAELVVPRIEQIKQLLLECEDEAQGRKRLSEKYLLDRFLESLESWAVEEFETSSPEPIFRYRPSPQSQGAPPASSSQVTQDAGPSVPEGYDHAALLLTPQVTSPRVWRAVPGGGEEDDDEDEDDSFENNPRNLTSHKRPGISSELADRAPTRPAPEAPRSTAEPHPARIFNARQRHPWSDRDSRLLIECVGKYRASWGKMAKSADADAFERGAIRSVSQQELRDRARNMKMEMLLGDLPLPLSFDLVKLGKKEKRRLRLAGKNPYRLEHEVDRNGRPVSTEFDPAIHPNEDDDENDRY
ncbi:hypothetical protein N3K66_000605 [Trichothecium roseum]|uniref:Uncharacterized protein n=1 Tax=Trichothecium roseum TaxID=47278 RepID=A0ACC0VC99_9HYPO|nr:hypothetical protein N3K66_000605 [Trichothecium roseum]